MIWATRELVHFDRVASAWLIKRFVDPEAEFTFLSAEQTAEAGAVTFGFPGAEFGSHDQKTTTFGRIAAARCPDDDLLASISELVFEGVQHVLQNGSGPGGTRVSQAAINLLRLTEGMMLITASDAACIEASRSLYDALYAHLQAASVINAALPSPPATLLEQTSLLAYSIKRARDLKVSFSKDVVAEVRRSL